jgi:ubiquinol-cytochrome c reductase cytochrome b subunit
MQKLLDWVDERFPARKAWEEHFSKYYAPKNFNFWYYFGSLATVVLVIQIVTGIFLTMHYKPDTALAFASVEYIMRDVPYGYLLRNMHVAGASFFFIVIYLHMFRGLLYGSFKGPRELVWILGMVLFVALMAEAFMGYLLPWGNMSYWGAQVIISLFDAIPLVGPTLSEWLRGDFVVSDATLNRFFSLHVIALPLLLALLVFLHIVALHKVGSNNPDGVEIKKKKGPTGIPLDGVPFHPYYTVGKDLFGIAVFLILFSAVVFFVPEFFGWFMEHDNFVPANILATPPDIKPLWYFTPFYAILRAVTEQMKLVLAVVVVLMAALTVVSMRGIKARTVTAIIAVVLLAGFATLEAKVWGVVLMGLAIVFFFFLPWLDRSPVKSIRYRGWMFKTALFTFAINFIVLGFLGTRHPDHVDLFLFANVRWAQFGTLLYFAFFLLMPWYTTYDKTKPVPDRVTWK